MKTFKQVTERFEKDMQELGVSGYVVMVRDPDSESSYWHRGSDILWQLGAIKMLSDFHRSLCADVTHEDNEDDGDSWKQ